MLLSRSGRAAMPPAHNTVMQAQSSILKSVYGIAVQMISYPLILRLRIQHACMNAQDSGGRGAAVLLRDLLVPTPVTQEQVMCIHCELAAEFQRGGTRWSGDKSDLSPDCRVPPP